jgi:group II intron reverse transcriptase/maturase
MGKLKHHNLYGQLLEDRRLKAAFANVHANGGSAGSDGVTVGDFAKDVEGNIRELIVDLRNKTYRPKAIRRVEIPKSSGGVRKLGIPAVRDRVVQECLRMILDKIFDGTFSEHSHGFRPQRGCMTALRDLFLQVRKGGVFVVDLDIEKCFDAIPHEPLIGAVAEEVADGSVLNLIEMILKAPIREGYRYVTNTSGTPQGSPMSPLLANIYLAQLDKKLAQDGIEFVRYADDVRATTTKPTEAREIKEKIGETLKAMGLKMSPTKTRLVSLSQGVNFLGYRIIGFKGKPYAVIPRDRVKLFKEKVRQLTRRNSHLSKETRVEALGNYVGGWGEYFKRAQQPDLFRELDLWIYRRLIAMYAGRWRSWLCRRYGIWYFREAGVPSLFRMHQEAKTGKPWTPKLKGNVIL